MSTSSPTSPDSAAQDAKLRSLRIDPDRKTNNSGKRFGVVALFVALVAGFLLANVLRSVSIVPAEVKKTRARTIDTSVSAAGRTLLSANGYITPYQRIALSPRVVGRVAWVGIEKGQKVEKNQVLVRLVDDEYKAQEREAEARVAAAETRLKMLEAGSRPAEISKARADLESARATLENARLALERQKTLTVRENVESKRALDDATSAYEVALARHDWAKNALALMEEGVRKEEIEIARHELEAARASLQFAKIQLENTIIRAPINGTILEKLIEIGELVNPQSFGGSGGARTELLSMADLTDLQVEVDVNESDFSKISMGQTAEVTLDAYPDSKFSAKVREIAPEADRTKATVQIKVKILNPDQLVRPEMGARVDFKSMGEAAAAGTGAKPDEAQKSPLLVVVPKSAIVQRDGRAAVFAIVEGKARMKYVSPGKTIEKSAETEVLSGLDGNEELVAEPPATLMDGARVRVSEGAAPASTNTEPAKDSKK